MTKIRRVGVGDETSIAALNTLVFGSTAEAEIIRRLHHARDDVFSLVKTQGSNIIGHIQFYKIGLLDQDAVGLGPMSVHPDFQRKGHGSNLVKKGLNILKTDTMFPIAFVLGHPGFYPKFGFSAEYAANFKAPWSGQSFMATKLRTPAPMSGTLTFPKALL